MKRGPRSLLVFCTVTASLLTAAGTARAEVPPSPVGTVSAGSGDLPSPGAVQASGGKTVCVRAHVADLGWREWSCNGIGTYVGTVGQNKAIEALQIYVSEVGEWGDYCAVGHVRNIGWYATPQQCATPQNRQIITVGTTGLALPLEAVAINFAGDVLHGWAHVQNIGWQYNPGKPGEDLILGTEGRALNLEAVSFGIK
ncbi:hypothetical protein ACIQUQ_28405 [Streptomyces sp. NPDC101118]|uniref:hypothetical protein n=1 Tax=Streptomyces sp. NPDC101118 TaxID=3366109 RepID=UPI00380EB09D